jgi:hypothetical protein
MLQRLIQKGEAMKLALMLSFAVVLGLVNGFGMFALLRWLPDIIRTRTQPFYMLLTHAHVPAGEQVRARLEAQAARRHVWGALGGGVGYGVGLTASLPLDLKVDGAVGLMSVGGLFFGSAVGQSLSALFPVNPSSGRVRVTAMQPHGMTDYLHRREIVVEVGLATLGWSSVVVGIVTLDDVVDISMTDNTAATLIVAGALLAVVATTALLGLRRRRDRVPVARRLLARSPAA